MLSRDDIGRHLTSEMFFSGDRLPGFSDTIDRACRGGACPAPAVVASSRPKAVP